MRLRYIELFHAILTSGSITGAAKLLDISQPAASKALQHAEDQLGFALFSRVRGRIQPTQQAQLLRDRIENIIQEVQELERLTTNISQPASRPLRVTCTPTLAQVLLPSATVLVRKTFPDVTVELSTEHSAAMCESLTLRETDIGLTLQDTGHQNLRQRVLCRGQVMAIAPPGWWPSAELSQPLPISALGQPALDRDHRAGRLGQHAAKPPGEDRSGAANRGLGADLSARAFTGSQGRGRRAGRSLHGVLWRCQRRADAPAEAVPRSRAICDASTR